MTSAERTQYMTGLKHSFTYEAKYSAKEMKLPVNWNAASSEGVRGVSTAPLLHSALIFEKLAVLHLQFCSQPFTCDPETFHLHTAMLLWQCLHSGTTSALVLTWHWWIQNHYYAGFLLKSDCHWYWNHTVFTLLLTLLPCSS